MFVRMVWGRLRSGAWGQYEQHYRQKALPLEIKGLRQRQLLRSTEDPDEGISLSVWDSWDDLVTYERSGIRQTLAQDAEHLYRPLSYSVGDYWVKHFEIISETPPPQN